MVGAGTGSDVCGQAGAPGFYRAARDCSGEKYSATAVRGFAESVPAGSGGQALRLLGRGSGLLRIFSESGRAVGALFVRLPRSSTAADVGRDLHGVAVGK